ncbi:hypothetical protein HMI01_18010 [Halolactibacillus miurensis]|uniref:Uncharacterized protein n=1 Tax=Halolactibacillus miurensis TaxID=306541 RepID=A0A1I6TX75_9BACI|nr:hypothetical protein HMI01_18010 [Halolactibacillus miurensis]SFS93780.1 hypothetical protein SAMN05421668_1199 [Halolactibacillus miurensis]
MTQKESAFVTFVEKRRNFRKIKGGDTKIAYMPEGYTVLNTNQGGT